MGYLRDMTSHSGISKNESKPKKALDRKLGIQWLYLMSKTWEVFAQSSEPEALSRSVLMLH